MAFGSNKQKGDIPPKKSNWKILQSQNEASNVRNRDVYNEQQLERSNIKPLQKPTSRIILTIILSLIIGFAVWLCFSGFEFFAEMTNYTKQNVSVPISQWGSLFMKNMVPTFYKTLVSLMCAGGFYLFFWQYMKRNLDAQNLMNDTSDINQYKNDQHIALPEEVQRKFDWFPDAGATSDVDVSSMISHMMLNNKGLNKVEFSKRAKEDIYDEDGDIEYYKGEELYDDDGNVVTELVPMIDEKFGQDLFETSGALKDYRKCYNPKNIQYNPGNKNRDKQKDCDTVADLINKDWKLPYYEPQRPAGAYVVDTDPVNTMVLAITRAGKGQTVIEPMIDMWTRERHPSNMVINDPKGELLVKNYVRASVRGYQPVQFNLINVMKTDIYNPLLMAADSAREGDFTKCAMYVENIADVFFPLDGGEDPVWPNAASNAFKRAAYGLIDFYLEEEKELRAYAAKTNMDLKVLETKIDEMWGKVTLYNSYQLFVQLTSKKLKTPLISAQKKIDQLGVENDVSDDELNAVVDDAKMRSELLWEGAKELDLLTLYFNAVKCLPRNQMRTLVDNADSSLRSMAGAEKMMASVYGIAITGLSFFVDPTISTLTSGTPSQNVDLAGLSFPRRIGVRFATPFLERYHLVGQQVKWQAFEDKDFKKPLGDKFFHQDLISREGWARYYFEGIFENEKGYIQLEIINPNTNVLIKRMYFEFTKSYQVSLNGMRYIKDPIMNEKIIRNGILREMVFDKKNNKYRYGHTVFPSQQVVQEENGEYGVEDIKAQAVIQTMVRYSEKPKAVFLVTPPHLMKYAKLILILIKQLVDLNFDQSYMTKSNQKPLYKTKFMLDELGNLQSDGHGISNFETMLSIGLGQGQMFVLILQTLQQLRDVYGESVDKIVQGNTSNIIFLKSTDDSMLDTLTKMSGTTHRVYNDQKTVTRDLQRLVFQNEGKASFTLSAKEEPVISYNDLAFISERNSIIFRAGDSPIWNRNETILPMSWRLFQNTIKHPGHDYSLQTIPTLSSAKDFDIRKNQPDFVKMLNKKMDQAVKCEKAKQLYRDLFGYNDYDIAQLDPDIYADEIMTIINEMIADEKKDEDKKSSKNKSNENKPDSKYYKDFFADNVEDNDEVIDEVRRQTEQQTIRDKKIYAEGQLSISDLVGSNGQPNHQLDNEICKVYTSIRNRFANDRNYFYMKNRNVYGVQDDALYIERLSDSERKREMEAIQEASKDKNSRTYAEDGNMTSLFASYKVHDAFYKFLVELQRWDFCNGEFDRQMAKILRS